MAIMASDSGGGDYQPVPQGTYDAICYKIVDAGTSMNKFQDEVNKQHSIFIFWELPTCRTEDDRPMSIFHKYRLSQRRQREGHRCVLCGRWAKENGNRKRTGSL